MKNARQAKIFELVQNKDIETQEELSDRLVENGFRVTQATISRDIKELRLVKVLSGSGRYRYSLPAGDTAADGASKYYGMLRESVIGLDYAANLVVVRCHTGMANAACAAIDSLDISGIVGTVAGDDTFLIVARTESCASKLLREISDMLG